MLIKIKTQSIRNQVKKITDEISRMQPNSSNISSEIDSIDAMWDGKDAVAFQSAFSDFSSGFPPFYSSLEDMANGFTDYLDDVEELDSEYDGKAIELV